MKKCPKCGQAYSDPALNFCLNDGELLLQGQESHSLPSFEPPTRYADDPPPTVMMNDVRATDPTGWQPSSIPAQWQGQQIVTPPGHSPVQYNQFTSPNQVLAIISVCLGAASLTIGWCCSSGLLLGPAAIVTGIIALVQNKNNPAAYGGKGLAIGGIITGGLFLLSYILFIIIYGLAVIGGGIR